MRKIVVVGSAVAVAAVVAVAAIMLGVGGTKAKGLIPLGQKTFPLPTLNPKSTPISSILNNLTGAKTKNPTVDIVKGASVMKAGGKAFNPDPIQVSVGGTVTWKNSDAVAHTVTSGKGPGDPHSGKVFDSKLISPGKTFEYKFTHAGTYYYYCTAHPAMVGRVVVK
jgi:plastocyanin